MAEAKSGVQAGWRRRINSHEAFVHDSIDSLGYDWSRIGEPGVTPRFPLRVYLPQSTEDVVTVVREAKELGLPVTVRARGHSSNDLVLAGTVLLTEKLDALLAVDEDRMTATVGAGAASADIDDQLAARGLGLPVIGDHAHVTVGGFTSVGGISASSFRYGMFVDVVEAVEYVTWDGEVARASRSENAKDFYRLLLGLGRFGVITTVTVRIVRVDKYRTLWRNRQTHYRSLDHFLQASRDFMSRPPVDARFMRGMWVDFGSRGIGQFSIYAEAEPTPFARFVDGAAYGFLHRLGYVAGRLPAAVDRALKFVGLAGILYAPRYATIKNAESFSDKILDATVGDPTRYLVALVRQAAYEEVSRRLLTLLRTYRDRHGCFSVITLYVKGIRSPYLAQGRPDDDRWVEVLFFVAIKPERMKPELLEQLAAEIDDVCVETGSYRYMHSKTSKDPDRLVRIDPNAAYADGRSPWPSPPEEVRP
jgi:hypothetical protein